MNRNSQVIDSVDLVHRLRQLGLSPEQFASECELSNVTIRNYEAGMVARPRRSTVAKINAALNRLERFEQQMHDNREVKRWA